MANSYDCKKIYDNAFLLAKSFDLKDVDADERGKILNALAFASKDLEGEFKPLFKEMLEIFSDLEEAFSKDNLDLENLLVGNAYYKMASLTGEEKYIDLALKLAKKIPDLKRSDKGFFLNTKGKECPCVAFKALSFYMNYETNNGGKEHYNDIIAQFSAIYNEKIGDLVLELKNGNEKAYKPLVYFLAGIVDTLEVMDQALYEIWAKLSLFYKETLKAVLKSARYVMGKNNELDLILVYAIFKGCRMKLIHTEKYEFEANALFDAINEELDEILDASANVKSAYILAASESVKNREYQDYGRLKGGVLWS